MNLQDYKDEIEKCVKCGTCASTCTVYKELLLESTSTRGKLALVDAYLNGELKITDNLIDRLKKCTLCLKCAQNCPNGIKVDEIFFLFWNEILKDRGLNLIKNTVFYKIMMNKGYIKVFSFLNKYLSFFAFSRNKLQDTQKMFFTDRNIPVLNYKDVKQDKKIDTPKDKVAIFTGCLIDYCYPNIKKSLVDILSANNIKVEIPDEQVCCGAPFYTLGDIEQAKELAIENLELFKKLDVSKILTVCATCLAVLKHRYLWLLGDDAEKYKDVIDKFEDSSVYLNKTGHIPAKTEKYNKIYYHDPCHLKNALGIYDEPRNLIKQKTDTKFIADSDDLCCGFGGSFNMDYYDLSCKICDKIIDKIKFESPDLILTGCPACMMQIKDGLSREKIGTKVMHLVEFLGVEQKTDDR